MLEVACDVSQPSPPLEVFVPIAGIVGKQVNQRILILGGAGFMGRALSQHWRAAGFDVSTPAHADAPLEVGDALERAVAAARPSTIVNLAALSSPIHSDERELYELNAFGHLRLLEGVARAAPEARVFLASTANVYGRGEGGRFRESDTPAPINHYAISKLMAEQFNRLFSDRLTVCAARPFNCIGRGQKKTLVISKLIDAFRRRLPELQLGDLSVERDFVDIRDVCAMWDVLIGLDAPPPIVNFGTGKATPLLNVIALLEQLTGRRVAISSSPQFMRARDIAYQQADVTLLTTLGFTRQHELADTLSWMIADDGEGE